jgi:flagellar protein FlgJ
MNNRMTEAQNFLDLNGLNQIRQQSNATDSESKQAALESAAKQFEAIFMQMLMKSMRKAEDVLASDSPFNSESTKFYRDMHDQQLSLDLSNNGSLGLSQLIVRQLGGDTENFTPHNLVRADAELPSHSAVAKDKRAEPPFTTLPVPLPDPAISAMPNTMANAMANTIPNAISGLSHNEHRQQAWLQHNELPFGLQTTADLSLRQQVNAPFSSSANTIKNQSTNTTENHAVVAFAQPQDFVTALTDTAKQVEQQLKVPFAVVIAQAALETGWGQKIIKTAQGQSSHNLFNIKADARWSGEKTHKETLEYQQGAMVKKREPFRVYQSMAESAKDYIDFLSNNDRYQGALKQVGNVEQFLHKLQSAGYATDPNYAKKILATLKTVTGILEQNRD